MRREVDICRFISLNVRFGCNLCMFEECVTRGSMRGSMFLAYFGRVSVCVFSKMKGGAFFIRKASVTKKRTNEEGYD